MAPTTKRGVQMDAAAFASLGPGQLRPGREVDAVDGVVPEAVITPRSLDHIGATLEEARNRRLGIVVCGGGTSFMAGNIPEAFHIRLVMTGLASKLERNPADMTVRVDAGVTLARVNRALAPNGQRVALDPPYPERATVGGLVAANMTGGLRYGFGNCRDLVLGMSVIDGKLRRYECGAQVVKNVAGYDLPRLFTGSWGTLAVITEITLRTHPLPEEAATLLFEFDDGRELDVARARLTASHLPLAAMDFAVDVFGGDQSWTLALRVEGTEAEVAYQAEKAAELAGREIGESAEEWWSPAHADPSADAVLRLGVPPARAVSCAEKLAAELGRTTTELSIAGHLGAGLLRITLPGDPGGATGARDAGRAESDAPSVGAGVAARGGAGTSVSARLAAIDAAERMVQSLRADPEASAPWANLTIEKAGVDIKRGRDVWGRVPGAADLMREIKKRFDPDRVLAPGRFVGGI